MRLILPFLLISSTVATSNGATFATPSIGVRNIDFLATSNPQMDSSPTSAKVTAIGDTFYEGCGSSKKCFGMPANCVSSKDCTIISAVTVTGDIYDFELQASRNAEWVGIGLSDDNRMGDDSCIECVHFENEINAYMTWTGREPFSDTRLDDPQYGITLIESSKIDDTIYCKVRRIPETIVQGVTFNLINDTYYLLIGAGDINRVTATGITGHNLGKQVSASKRSLSDTSEVKPASKILIHLHGSFMLVAWIGTSSVGILLARYYRQSWKGKTFMGKDLWFSWHQICMCLTLLLTLAAFVLIFVEIKEWSQGKSTPHAILGTIATAFCFLQPIMAYFRTPPGTLRREVFNWAHWLVGISAHLLAIINIFLAVGLTKVDIPDEAYYVLSVYLVVNVVVYIVLSLFNYILRNKSETKSTSIPMKYQNGTGTKSPNTWKNLEKRFARWRTIIIGLYIVVLIAVVISLIVLSV